MGTVLVPWVVLCSVRMWERRWDLMGWVGNPLYHSLLKSSNEGPSRFCSVKRSFQSYHELLSVIAGGWLVLSVRTKNRVQMRSYRRDASAAGQLGSRDVMWLSIFPGIPNYASSWNNTSQGLTLYEPRFKVLPSQ